MRAVMAEGAVADGAVQNTVVGSEVQADAGAGEVSELSREDQAGEEKDGKVEENAEMAGSSSAT